MAIRDQTSTALNKLPPQNIEAEQSLLGALLIDKDAIVNVAEVLNSTHFYKSEQHGQIYSAILELFEKREPKPSPVFREPSVFE